MGGLWESANEINKDVLALTMILSGLFICFFGAKFFKHIIFFVGFIFGGLAAYFLVPEMMALFSFDAPSDDMLLYVSLACGAAVGVLFVVIYKAAVFSCGAVAGVILCQAIWQSIVMPLGWDDKMPNPDVFQVVAWIIFALAGGWLAFKLAEFVLKGVTAFIGAFLFASSTAYFISRLDGKENSHDVLSWLEYFSTSTTYRKIGQTCNSYCYVCLSLWIILFFSGCYVQYKFHKKHRRKDYDDDISETGEESEEEVDERKQKREALKAQKKARQGGSVQPVRDGSMEMSRGYSGGSTGQNYAGRASYYTQNQGYSGYNGYSPNYGNGYSSGYNSGANYYAQNSGGNVNYV